MDDNVILYDDLCPKCGSAKTYLSSKDGYYRCEDCDHVWKPVDDSKLEEDAARTDFYEQGDR